MESWQHGCYAPSLREIVSYWYGIRYFHAFFRTILKGQVTGADFCPLLIFVRGWIDPRVTM